MHRIEALVKKWREAPDDKELVMVAGFHQTDMAQICADQLDEALPHWLIFFADASMKPEYFTGLGAERAARERYKQLLGNWNCRLFREEA